MENEYNDSCTCCSNSRIYEDFVPSSELVHGKDYDTLLLNLPGFKKEEVKVQLCKTGIIKISGQRPVNKFLSFQKDIPVSRNCDKGKINARLVNGILYVKHPKLITKNEKELSTSASEPEQDHKKTELSTSASEPKQVHKKTELLASASEPEQDHKKTELDELGNQDNAENAPTKEEPKATSPKTSEQTQVKQDESMKDDTTQTASGLFTKLKVSRQVVNMALAALVVLGIGRYVVNAMRSPKKAKE